MSNISQWSTSAASNSAAPPNGWPENTMLIPQVNDSARENMAAVARWYGDMQGSLVTGGSGNAYTLTSNSSHAALADQSMFVFRADRTNTGAATLNVDGLGAKDMVVKGGQALESGNIVEDQMLMAVYNSEADHYEISLVGSGTTASDLASSALGFALVNGTLAASVESNALTVEIKTLSGDDPSAGNPVFALFRNATLSNGTFVVRRIEAATSLVIPDGATLGAGNNTPFRYWLTMHDDSGTVRLGASNRKLSTGISPLNEAALVSTSAIGAGSDSAGTIYTGTSVSSRPMQVVGYLEYTSGLATAGTYNNAPDIVHLRTWATKLPGDAVQAQSFTMTDQFSGQGTQQQFDTITGFEVDITPTSAANPVDVSAHLNVGGAPPADVLFIAIRLQRDGNDIALGEEQGSRTRGTSGTTITSNADVHHIAADFLDSPNTTSEVTYGASVAPMRNNQAVHVNRSAANTNAATSLRTVSTIKATEIMG